MCPRHVFRAAGAPAYGFFLVNDLKKFYYALGWGLLTIVSALFRRKCNQTKCSIRKCQNIFSFIKAPFDDLNTFLKCIWNKDLCHLYLGHFYFKGEKA